MSTYVVNRLRVDGQNTKKVMLTKVASRDEGYGVGAVIENRGNVNARWSFVGQIESDKLLPEHSYGIEDDRLLRDTGVDLTTKGIFR